MHSKVFHKKEVAATPRAQRWMASMVLHATSAELSVQYGTMGFEGAARVLIYRKTTDGNSLLEVALIRSFVELESMAQPEEVARSDWRKVAGQLNIDPSSSSYY